MYAPMPYMPTTNGYPVVTPMYAVQQNGNPYLPPVFAVPMMSQQLLAQENKQ
jgi:hypothetical protein